MATKENVARAERKPRTPRVTPIAAPKSGPPWATLEEAARVVRAAARRTLTEQIEQGRVPKLWGTLIDPHVRMFANDDREQRQAQAAGDAAKALRSYLDGLETTRSRDELVQRVFADERAAFERLHSRLVVEAGARINAPRTRLVRFMMHECERIGRKPRFYELALVSIAAGVWEPNDRETSVAEAIDREATALRQAWKRFQTRPGAFEMMLRETIATLKPLTKR